MFRSYQGTFIIKLSKVIDQLKILGLLALSDEYMELCKEPGI